MTAFKEVILENHQPFPAEIFLRDSRDERIVAPLHWHECVELLYWLEGHASQQINDQYHDVQAGDLVLLREGDLHATRTAPGDVVRVLVVKFMPTLLSGAATFWAESAHIRSFLDRDNPRIIHLAESHPAAQTLREQLKSLLEEWTRKQPAYELSIHGLLYGIITSLTRLDAFPSRHASLAEKELLSLLKQAETQLPIVMTLTDAAKAMNYSYTHFSRYFNKTMGSPFKGYMDYMRIREAERLILRQGCSLTDAARQTGFSDSATFSRTYRRLRGQAARTLLKG